VSKGAAAPGRLGARRRPMSRLRRRRRGWDDGGCRRLSIFTTDHLLDFFPAVVARWAWGHEAWAGAGRRAAAAFASSALAA
jgi:hypothetical protein